MVVLPGVLSIQDDGHERIAALCMNCTAVLPDAIKKVVGRGAGIHARIHKPDEVAEEVIPEQQLHFAAILAPNPRPVGFVHPCNPMQVAPRTPLSVAIHSNPASAANANASSETEPSDGHMPRGACPKRDMANSLAFSI